MQRCWRWRRSKHGPSYFLQKFFLGIKSMIKLFFWNSEPLHPPQTNLTLFRPLRHVEKNQNYLVKAWRPSIVIASKLFVTKRYRYFHSALLPGENSTLWLNQSCTVTCAEGESIWLRYVLLRNKYHKKIWVAPHLIGNIWKIVTIAWRSHNLPASYCFRHQKLGILWLVSGNFPDIVSHLVPTTHQMPKHSENWSNKFKTRKCKYFPESFLLPKKNPRPPYNGPSVKLLKLLRGD